MSRDGTVCLNTPTLNSEDMKTGNSLGGKNKGWQRPKKGQWTRHMQRPKTIGEVFSCMQIKKTIVIFLIFAISTYNKRHILKDIFVSTPF